MQLKFIAVLCLFVCLACGRSSMTALESDTPVGNSENADALDDSDTEGGTADTVQFGSASAYAVIVQPEDMTTNTGNTPLRFYIPEGATTELLVELGTLVSLRTIEGVAIPFTVKPFVYTNATASGCTKPCDVSQDVLLETETRSFVEVVPDHPLSNTWHVLSVSKLPGKFYYMNRPLSDTPTPLFGTAHSVRFHPGSNPQVRHIRLSGDLEKDTLAALVVFSEPVLLDSVATSIFVTATGAKCVVWGLDQAPVEVLSSSVMALPFMCTFQPSGDKSKWQFALKKGGKSSTGLPLRIFPDHEVWFQDIELPAAKKGKWDTVQGTFIKW